MALEYDLKPGDKVVCLYGSIDRNKHKGETGVVSDFARFSAYHSREASVKFEDGSCEWFWVSSLEKVNVDV